MARLAELSKEEKAKVGKELYTNSNVDPEWMFIAEFGGYFGYSGVEALLQNKITLPEAEVLIDGQRKIWDKRMYDIAEATFASSAASQSGKKAGSVFQQMTRRFIKGMRVKE
jgi:hypothetical protein